MTLSNLKTQIAKNPHFARIAKLPHHFLIPLVVLAVILLAVAGGEVFSRHKRAAHPATVVAGAAQRPAGKTADATPVSVPSVPPRASQNGTQAVPVSPAITADPAVQPTLQPPAGIQAGTVERVIENKDQFDQWTQVAASPVSVPRLSVTAPVPAMKGPQQRARWSTWIKLDQGATVATLRAAGGSGTVSAAIDGTSLGRPLVHWGNSIAEQETASITLAPGWHKVTIAAVQDSGQTQGSTAEIAIGDGSADPTVPEPWAVTSRPAATPLSVPTRAPDSSAVRIRALTDKGRGIPAAASTTHRSQP